MKRLSIVHLLLGFTCTFSLLGVNGEQAVPVLPSVSEEEVQVLEQGTVTNQYLNLTRSGMLEKYQTALESARSLRGAKKLKQAESAFIQLLEGRAPEEVKRAALLDLAMVLQEQRETTKAQRLFTEFTRRYSKDPAVPEILLRQAYLYREMGVSVLALSKFYAVISTCLSLKLDEMDYYQKLVLRAQAEIAETYFLDGKFAEAADYFTRLQRLEGQELDQAEVLYKLARCLNALERDNETVAAARNFLEKYPGHLRVGETRFLLASGLKRLGRTDEAIREIEQLLQVQQASSDADPRQWVYWQQKAGNEIANQLYQEGDYIHALQVYEILARLSQAPEWQMPVWYQIGLTFENLKQPAKATEMYEKVIAREKQVAEGAASPSLRQISEMAAWRMKCLAWETSAQSANRELQNSKQEAL